MAGVVFTSSLEELCDGKTQALGGIQYDRITT
jgi:hypothetical protein